MTDTQEAMREEFAKFQQTAEYLQMAQSLTVGGLEFFNWESGYKAATAQSAEKMAMLEAEMVPLRIADEVNAGLWKDIDEAKLESGYTDYEKEVNGKSGRYTFTGFLRSQRRKLAAAELSNNQLREELQYAKACLPDLPLYDPAAERLRKALAQPISTKALDAYVEKLIPPGWKVVPIEPTIEMVQATGKSYAESIKRYRAMLEVAPQLFPKTATPEHIEEWSRHQLPGADPFCHRCGLPNPCGLHDAIPSAPEKG